MHLRNIAAQRATGKLSKSAIYFSQCVHGMHKKYITICLGVEHMNQTETYLGVPLFHNRAKRQIYHYFVDKYKANSKDGKHAFTCKDSVDQICSKLNSNLSNVDIPPPKIHMPRHQQNRKGFDVVWP